MDADVMLANADLPYVYQHLLPQDKIAKAVARKHFSCSAISFFLGVDKAYPGTVIPTAMVSGRLASEQIMNELGA